LTGFTRSQGSSSGAATTGVSVTGVDAVTRRRLNSVNTTVATNTPARLAGITRALRSAASRSAAPDTA